MAGGDPVQLTTSPAHDSHPVWSPDGSRIAFSSNRGGTPHVWTISASGDDLQRVTEDGDRVYFHHVHGCHTTWSPDGESIAFLSAKGGNRNVWIKPSGGGAARQLTHDSGFGGNHPEWSIDGELIAYATATGSDMFSAGENVWVIPVTEGIPRQLTTDPASDGVPSWSPNGQLLAFQSNRGGGFDIWVMPATGGTAVQITDMGDAYVPRWSPNGRKISFHRTPQPGKSDIWIADVSDIHSILANMPHQRIAGQVTIGGAPRANASIRVTDHGGTAYQATTSEDGRYQVWAEPGSYEVLVADTEGADPVELTLNAGDRKEGIDFAPTSIGTTVPTWPFTTAVVLLGIAALVCVIPLYSRRSRLGAVILSPKRALQEISAQPDWVGPLFIILVATLVFAVGFTGKMLPELGSGLGGGSGVFGLLMMIGLPVFTLLAGFVGSLAVWTIRTAAIWVLARIFGERANFYVLFSVVGYSYLPEMLLGSLVGAAAVGFSFIEFSMSDPSNMVTPTSLLLLLPEGTVHGEVVRHLFGQIELFALWSLAITIIGVQRVYTFTMTKAAVVVVLYWMVAIGVTSGFVALMAMFQELM